MKHLLVALLLFSQPVFCQMPSQSCYEDVFPKQAENKLWGYVNIFDEWKVEPVFNKIFPFVGNKGIVEKNGRFGVVGCDGKMIIPADYEEIGPLANGPRFWVKKTGKWALADEKGQISAVGNVLEIKEVANGEVTWLKMGEETFGLYDKRKMAFCAAPRYSLFQILSEKASIVQYKEKFGIVSHQDGSYLFEPVITSLKKMTSNVIAFQENAKWGILNQFGEVKKVAELDSIGFLLNNLFFASQEGKCGLINSIGKPVLPLEYEEVNPFYEHMSLIKKNGAYGYTNLAGQVTVPVMYEWGDIFQNEQTIVKTGAGYFIIDKNNRKVSKQNYKWLLKTPNRSYYAAHRDGKYLFLDLTGKEMMPPTFGFVVATDTNQFVRVQNDTTKRWSFYDVIQNKLAFDGKFDEASAFKWKYAFVKKNEAWGVIDEKGKTIVPSQYTSLHYLINNYTAYFVAETKGYQGLLTNMGVQILPLEYRLISSSSSNLLKVKKADKYFVLNMDGSETTKSKYDGLSNQQENPTIPDWPAIIVRKKKYGLLAQNQQEIVKPEYTDISYLGDNLYVCSQNLKKGILAANGKILVSPAMDEIRPQSEKYLPFKQTGKWGYVFNTGKIMIPPTYEEAGNFYKNLALVKMDGKWGIVNKQGRWILKNEFESVHYLPNGKRRLQSANKLIEITEKGIVKQLN